MNPTKNDLIIYIISRSYLSKQIKRISKKKRNKAATISDNRETQNTSQGTIDKNTDKDTDKGSNRLKVYNLYTLVTIQKL